MARIPDRVLDWRDGQREGSIMSKKTFEFMVRRARKEGYRDPMAVAGKAYWIAVLSKYLEFYPDDSGARKVLNEMLRSRRGGSYRNPKARNPVIKVSYKISTREIQELAKEVIGRSLTGNEIRRLLHGMEVAAKDTLNETDNWVDFIGDIGREED